MTRKCDRCGKDIPLGANQVRVRFVGYNYPDTDFCKPICFALYYERRSIRLKADAK